MSADMFPEVESDREAVLRRRTWARHKHNRVVDPNDNERYTLDPTLALSRAVATAGHIDIDLAACPEAHCAEEWLGLQNDGTFRDSLTSSWNPKWYRGQGRPRTGWLNPPYDQLLDFTERASLAMIDGELDLLLYLPPGDRCEQPWWQNGIEPYRDGRALLAGMVEITTHCLPGRQRFGSPGDPFGLTATSAPFPSVLVVWRRA